MSTSVRPVQGMTYHRDFDLMKTCCLGDDEGRELMVNNVMMVFVAVKGWGVKKR